jgi:DNA-binding MarR family transcriptional regulator
MTRRSKLDSPGSLQGAIKQNQPFRSRQQEVYLSILRTSIELSHSTEQLLKKYEVTQAQYNVLRILQGAGPDGLGRNEISQRMVAITPDMTRLLDRLEVAGLVVRKRDRADKRQTSTTITDAGRSLLQQVEERLLRHHKAQLQGLSASEMEALLTSLEAIRSQLGKIPESK